MAAVLTLVETRSRPESCSFSLPGDGPEVPAGEGEARGGSGLAGSGIRVTFCLLYTSKVFEARGLYSDANSQLRVAAILRLGEPGDPEVTLPYCSRSLNSGDGGANAIHAKAR